MYLGCTGNYPWVDLPHPANDPLRNSLSQKKNTNHDFAELVITVIMHTLTDTHILTVTKLSALLVKMETSAECVTE